MSSYPGLRRSTSPAPVPDSPGIPGPANDNKRWNPPRPDNDNIPRKPRSKKKKRNWTKWGWRQFGPNYFDDVVRDAAHNIAYAAGHGLSPLAVASGSPEQCNIACGNVIGVKPWALNSDICLDGQAPGTIYAMGESIPGTYSSIATVERRNFLGNCTSYTGNNVGGITRYYVASATSRFAPRPMHWPAEWPLPGQPAPHTTPRSQPAPSPAPYVMPQLDPETQPGKGPNISPTPKPVPYPRVPQLRPYPDRVNQRQVGYGVAVSPQPGTGVHWNPKPVPYAPGPPRPPRAGEKERKFGMTGPGASAMYTALRYAMELTELSDLVSALWKAMPAKLRRESGCTNQGCRLVYIAKHLDDINMADALWNIIENQVEDALVGRAHALFDRWRKAARAKNPHADYILNKLLSVLRNM